MAKRIIGDPWMPEALAAIGATDRVAFLGSSLTMVDVVLSLRAQGHRGPLCAISRHGLLPRAHLHGLPGPIQLKVPAPLPSSAHEQLRWLRTAIADAARRGIDWRCVIDAVRYDAARLWQALPPREQARFLRHLRSYWDVHRHRMAPEIAAQLAALRQSGELTIAAARLVAAVPASDGLCLHLRPRHAAVTTALHTDWLVSCTGPACRFDDRAAPLLQSLIRSGEARPDALQLGLDTAGDGRVIGADGHPSSHVFALGTAARSRFWEVTSVPDLRYHCAALAETLSLEFAERDDGARARVAAPRADTALRRTAPA